MNNAVDWEYYEKYRHIDAKYLPERGEGENMATQIVTATTKLVYKWYNDGDVFDNTHQMRGWANDLSDYANWLYRYAEGADAILDGICDCDDDDDYELLLKELVDLTNTEEYLASYKEKAKTGSIYDCDGPFMFKEEEDNYDEY